MSLVKMVLRPDGFDKYRCDRNVSLGLNLANFATILKCAGNEDVLSLEAEDKPDLLKIILESPGEEMVFSLEGKRW